MPFLTFENNRSLHTERSSNISYLFKHTKHYAVFSIKLFRLTIEIHIERFHHYSPIHWWCHPGPVVRFHSQAHSCMANQQYIFWDTNSTQCQRVSPVLLYVKTWSQTLRRFYTSEHSKVLLKTKTDDIFALRKLSQHIGGRTEPFRLF